jgi:hypothetical protein
VVAIVSAFVAFGPRPYPPPISPEGKSPAQFRGEVLEQVHSYPRWFRSDFERLHVGMSWPDVQSTLGDRVELVEQKGAGETATSRIRFQNKDGSRILVTIQGGTLVSKSQSGLREPPGP